GLIHESNAFADTPTRIDDFMRFGTNTLRLVAPSSGTEVGGAMLESDELGALTEPTSVAMALSSGPVEDLAATTLVDELVEQIIGIGDDGPDAVVACLHGSMCSTTDPDVESTVLTRIRAALGPAVPVVATLDWHASVTDRMVESADAIIAYRTYPHIDQEERGREAARLALRLTGDTTRLSSTWIPVPMMIAGPATRHDHPTMRSVLDRARDLAERDERIVTWSVIPGFARSDTHWSGTHVYVAATDGAAGREMAREIAASLWAARDSLKAQLASVDDAVDRATAVAARVGRVGPVVLSDQGDNPGGGAPGDSTVLLEALEDRGTEGALVASLCAPGAVEDAHRAGVGGSVRLGVSGTDVEVRIEALTDGQYVIKVRLTSQCALRHRPAPSGSHTGAAWEWS
ncbi:MAG: M81 family metallopeptidase, partial [Ilumatobacteraceae bacterium]